MNDRLKYCPFCGGVDSVTIDKFNTLIPGFNLYAVFCDKDKEGCGATGPYKRSEEDAIEVWNRRSERETTA